MSGNAAGRLAGAMPRVLKELGGPPPRPLLVAGPPSAAAELCQALAAGGDPALVRAVSVDGLREAHGSALVYLVKGAATPTDERALRTAERRELPLIALQLGAEAGTRRLAYVTATNVIRADGIDEAAVERIGERLAAIAGEAAWRLARGLPALRPGVSRRLVERSALRSATIAAATFLPGPEFPALTLVQARLVLRLTAAHGVETEAARAVSLAGVVAAGLGWRAVARGAARLLPVPAWALQAAVAYAGTRALGAAALSRLARS